ncbi:hypothetical protein D1872_350960 [compost metagenome]
MVRLKLVAIDVHKKLHEFISRQKLGQNRQRVDIADVLLPQLPNRSVGLFKISFAAIGFRFSAQAVE